MMMFLRYVFVFVVFFCSSSLQGVFGIKHNLPPNYEVVNPADLGFDQSSIDLDSLLGNVKLLPINSQTDPKTGLKTQVLTVGFENDSEDLNLDDFELPTGAGNSSVLVESAFQQFKNYIKTNNKNVTGTTQQKPVAKQPGVVMRRRKVIKPTQQQKPKTEPKVVELDSAQIEKLLATGKLKSKKVGESQVIEITQEQLDDLYRMENGGEFKQLLSGGVPVSYEATTTVATAAPTVQATTPTTTQQQQQQRQQIVTQPTTPTVAVTTTTPPPPTQPPIIYQFNTKDLDNNYYQQQQQQQQQNYFPQQQQQYTPQVNKHFKTPTFEFISVPPVSYSQLVNSNKFTQQQQQYNKPVQQYNRFRQVDPLPRLQQQQPGKITFPQQQQQQSSSEQIPMVTGTNTYYNDDGLNYKNSGLVKEEWLLGV